MTEKEVKRLLAKEICERASVLGYNAGEKEGAPLPYENGTYFALMDFAESAGLYEDFKEVQALADDAYKNGYKMAKHAEKVAFGELVKKTIREAAEEGAKGLKEEENPTRWNCAELKNLLNAVKASFRDVTTAAEGMDAENYRYNLMGMACDVARLATEINTALYLLEGDLDNEAAGVGK